MPFKITAAIINATSHLVKTMDQHPRGARYLITLLLVLVISVLAVGFAVAMAR